MVNDTYKLIKKCKMIIKNKRKKRRKKEIFKLNER